MVLHRIMRRFESELEVTATRLVRYDKSAIGIYKTAISQTSDVLVCLRLRRSNGWSHRRRSVSIDACFPSLSLFGSMLTQSSLCDVIRLRCFRLKSA